MSGKGSQNFPGLTPTSTSMSARGRADARWGMSRGSEPATRERISTVGGWVALPLLLPMGLAGLVGRRAVRMTLRGRAMTTS